MMKMGRRCWTPRLLLLVVVVLRQILLFINQAASSTADKTIRIGYLASYERSMLPLKWLRTTAFCLDTISGKILY